MITLKEGLLNKKNIKNIIVYDTYVIIPFDNDMKIIFDINKYKEYILDYTDWNVFYMTSYDLEKIYLKPAKTVIDEFNSPYTKVWRTVLDKNKVENLFNSDFHDRDVRIISKCLKTNKNFVEIK